jgi:hypothetical protein
MSTEMIRGGALLVGSLEWEKEGKEDGQRGIGKARGDWRKRLGDSLKVSGLPIRYARISGETAEQVKERGGAGAVGAQNGLGRRGQYTMCLTKDVEPVGQALFRPFLKSFSGYDNLLEAAEALADAEGFKGGNFFGVVAIWVNPESKHRGTLEDWWRRCFPERLAEKCAHTNERPLGSVFPEIVDDSSMVLLPWPKDSSLKEVDFCLCTPTVPSGGEWNAEKVAEASKAAFENGKGRYFRYTYECGIRTADDDAIIYALKAFNADQEIMPSLDGGLVPGPQG